MYFNVIRINKWQQFETVNIEFGDKLTILTGTNGSGKTSILKLLATHCDWYQSFLSTPKKGKESESSNIVGQIFFPEFGQLIYSNNHIATLKKSKAGMSLPPQYDIEIEGSQEINCFFIPSHSSVPQYQIVSDIPMSKKKKKQAFAEVYSSNRARYLGETNQSGFFIMKSTLIGWAFQGYESEVMSPDPEQRRYFEGFPMVLKKVLPRSLGFEKIEIRNAEIVFICNGGQDEFLLETVSGGIAALIDIAWQIYMYSTKEDEGFTVIIDEIENHLHPSMQRRILSDLLEAFPSIRFIISTHSPLIVGSVREAKVYALVYNENKKVVSKKLDFQNKAKTAAEILDEALGVSFSMPIWAEKKLEKIVSTYSEKSMTEEEFSRMKNDLEEIGLERLIPSAITKVFLITTHTKPSLSSLSGIGGVLSAT